MLASPSPFLPTLLDLAPITLARSQAAPAPEAAAPAPAAEKKADAPKDAEAPADAPKHKKKKVRHFSPVVPVLVIQLDAPEAACCPPANASLSRAQAAPATDAAAPAPAAEKKADAPADTPKPKKKKVQHFSPVVPVLVIWVLLWLPAVHPQTPHFLVHRPLPRLTLPLPPLLRRRRLTRPQMLPSPRRTRLHTLALLVQSFLPCVRLLPAAFLHTCTPTLSFFPCLF